MSEPLVLVSSSNLPPQQAGNLLELPRQEAGWEWMSFFVRRLQPGDVYRTRTEGEEAAFVFLGGTCVADWGAGKQSVSSRWPVVNPVVSRWSSVVGAATARSFEAPMHC